jgi:two-component sensor histidine kinase
MINITFDTDINDKISGIVYINSDFISNDTKDILVSIKMEIKYNFINELFQNALNFALYGNNAEVISVSLNPTITSKIIDEGKLKDWIDDTIKRGLGKNIFNLLEDPIDLSIYFKRTQKVELEIKDNEYYIFNGNPRI